MSSERDYYAEVQHQLDLDRIPMSQYRKLMFIKGRFKRKKWKKILLEQSIWDRFWATDAVDMESDGRMEEILERNREGYNEFLNRREKFERKVFGG